jgi:hypothetical protein
MPLNVLPSQSTDWNLNDLLPSFALIVPSAIINSAYFLLILRLIENK